jgi:hypothetical protein
VPATARDGDAPATARDARISAPAVSHASTAQLYSSRYSVSCVCRVQL